jgi:hypothetical protein
VGTLAISLIALGLVAVAFAGVVLWDVFVPKVCPSCKRRGLRCINFIRATPGPNYSTLRCPGCGDEFVQVNGRIEARKGTKWEHEEGW